MPLDQNSLALTRSLSDVSAIAAAMPNYDWRQLLIIGNGFDLQCGLPSKFSDFFEVRRRKLERCQMYAGSRSAYIWANEVENSGLTVWDVILENGVAEYWFNIEAAIQEWITPSGPNKKSQKIAIIENYIKDFVRNDKPSRVPEDKDGAVFIVALYLFCKYDLSDFDGLNTAELYRCFEMELHLLEADFASYLKKAVDDSTHYQDNACSLLDKLLSVERVNPQEWDIFESVLSFNYTIPERASVDSREQLSYVNVHGRLADSSETDIIIGIDAADCWGSAMAMPFTKTFRVMGIGAPYLDEVLHIPTGGKYDTTMDLLKFYGHSLASADYSYFQSIFDSINLYSGSTRLIFFYHEHDDVNKEVERINTMVRVMELLTTYGKTLDNQDHGKNLVHKLLLEGRLSVQYLDLNDAASL